MFLLFLSSWLFSGSLILTTVIWGKRSSGETLAFIALVFGSDFGGIFLLCDWWGRTQPTVGHSNPWAGGPGIDKKAKWGWFGKWARKLHSSVTSVVPAFTFLPWLPSKWAVPNKPFRCPDSIWSVFSCSSREANQGSLPPSSLLPLPPHSLNSRALLYTVQIACAPLSVPFSIPIVPLSWSMVLCQLILIVIREEEMTAEKMPPSDWMADIPWGRLFN